MTLLWLTGWWNLIFVVPFALALLYLGLYTVSGWTFGDAEAELDLDHDVDAHLDVNGHIELDHDVDHDVDADGDGAADGESTAGSSVLSALNWIGVGRMPLSLVLMIQMLCWGVIGFATMQLQRALPIGRSFAIAAVVAGCSAILLTHFLSAILGPTLFKPVNTIRRWHQLLGARGEALYPIDRSFGMVRGRDERGELFQAACRVAEGVDSLAKGVPVQLVAYNAQQRMFFVVPADSAITPRQLAR